VRRALLFVLCFLLFLPLLVLAQEEKKNAPSENSSNQQTKFLMEDEAKSALKELDSDYYYDRKNARMKLKESGENGISLVRKVWRDVEISETARRELTTLLSEIKSKEAGLLLSEMALSEKERVLLVRQIEGLIVCAQECKDSAVREALEKLVSVLSKREDTEWLNKIICSAYRQLVISIFDWMVREGKTRGTYPGQYSRIKELGRNGIEALIDIIVKEDTYSHMAIAALLDIKPKEYADKIEALYNERKLPQIAEIEALLYIFGKQNYFSERLKRAEAQLELSPSDEGIISTLCRLYHHIGRYDRCEELTLKLARGSPSIYSFVNLACYQAMQNKKEAALKSIEKAFQLGYQDYEWIKQDKELDNIRETKEFKELLKKYLNIEEGEEKREDEKGEEKK